MGLTGALRRSFVGGLLLLTPLVVTLFVLRVLVGWSLIVVDPVVQGTRLARYTGNVEVAAQVLAAVLILIFVVAVGAVARVSVGKRLFGNVGRVVNVVPLVSTIYAGVREVATALVDRDAAYDRVVLVEYPREGIHSIGLVTGEAPPELRERIGEPAHTVFLPNSPNPTGGRTVVLADDEITELDMSVRRGLRLLVTTGVTEATDAAKRAAGDEGAGPDGRRRAPPEDDDPDETAA